MVAVDREEEEQNYLVDRGSGRVGNYLAEDPEEVRIHHRLYYSVKVEDLEENNIGKVEEDKLEVVENSKVVVAVVPGDIVNIENWAVGIVDIVEFADIVAVVFVVVDEKNYSH